MILPSKHLSQDRALLTVGATILRFLAQPMTMSALWEEMLRLAPGTKVSPHLRYDGFVLALDVLFLIDAIDYEGGLLKRKSP